MASARINFTVGLFMTAGLALATVVIIWLGINSFIHQGEIFVTYFEALHEKGLEIIDVPCNQFGGQAPGSDAEIQEFCTLKYNTQFPQMKKSDVNGANELPLFTWLKAQKGFEGFGFFLAALMMNEMLAV